MASYGRSLLTATDTGDFSRACWNITAPVHGFVVPSSAADGQIVKFWCEEGYERVGYSLQGCYAGEVSGSVECI